jgi:hypothetical protein
MVHMSNNLGSESEGGAINLSHVSQPNEDIFAPNINKSVAPVNAVAILTTTIVGFGVTAAADVFGNAIPAHAFTAAAAAWVIALFVALALVGRDAQREKSETFFKRSFTCIRTGIDRACSNKKYAALFVLISFCATYSAYAGFKKNATISGMASNVSAIGETTRQTSVDVMVIKRELASEEAKLSKLGYGTSDEHAWRALSDGNLEAMELMRGLGRKQFITTLPDKPNALEGLILNANADMTSVLKLASLSVPALDQRWHIESSYKGIFKLPDEVAMLESLGFAVVRKIPSDPSTGRPYIKFNPNQPLPWMAEVPALLFAVWARNEKAVEALLHSGASADAVSVRSASAYVYAEITRFNGPAKQFEIAEYDLTISALSEARRLGLKRVEAALISAGAKVVSKAKPVS